MRKAFLGVLVAFALLATGLYVLPASGHIGAETIAQVKYEQVPFVWDPVLGTRISTTNYACYTIGLPFTYDFFGTPFPAIQVSTNGMVYRPPQSLCTIDFIYNAYYNGLCGGMYGYANCDWPASSSLFGVPARGYAAWAGWQAMLAPLGPTEGTWVKVEPTKVTITNDREIALPGTRMVSQLVITNAPHPDNVYFSYQTVNWGTWECAALWSVGCASAAGLAGRVGANRGDGVHGYQQFRRAWNNEQVNHLYIPQSGESWQQVKAGDCQISTDFSDDAESGNIGWTVTGNQVGTGSFWHISSHHPFDPGHSPTHEWAYGQPAAHNYDTGNSVGFATSPPIVVSGETGIVEFTTRWMGEAYYISGLFDMQWIKMSLDGGATFHTVDSVWWGNAFADWSNGAAIMTWQLRTRARFAAVSGQTVQIQLAFGSGDAVANAYMGFHVDDIKVNSLVCDVTTLVPDDLSVSTDYLAPGNTLNVYYTVLNIGPKEGLVKEGSIAFPDQSDWKAQALLYEMDDADANQRLDVGGKATWIVALTFPAGTPQGITTVLASVKYNSATGAPVEATRDISVEWKNTGNRLSTLRHHDSYTRFGRCADFERDAGNGNAMDDASFRSALLDGKTMTDQAYKAGHSDFANNCSGLGNWGLARGQEEGNEGNGQGGLSGK